MLPPIRVVVQARMGSRRFPGKSMADLAGRPLLAWTVGRLQAAGSSYAGHWQVVVATTTKPADDRIEAWAHAADVPVIRGSETDVLGRFLLATADLDDEAVFLRATADNPFYCLRRTRDLVDLHREGQFDYAAIDMLSYAVPEVLTVGAFRRMATLPEVDAYCQEHATPLFRWSPNPFRTAVLSPLWNGLRPDLRLTIDTRDDLDRVEQSYSLLDDDNLLFNLDHLFTAADHHRLSLTPPAFSPASV